MGHSRCGVDDWSGLCGRGWWREEVIKNVILAEVWWHIFVTPAMREVEVESYLRFCFSGVWTTLTFRSQEDVCSHMWP